MEKIIFKVKDLVVLNGCPYDEQISEELEKYHKLENQVQIVTEIRAVSAKGTSGQWIKTDKESDWTDSVWYRKK